MYICIGGGSCCVGSKGFDGWWGIMSVFVNDIVIHIHIGRCISSPGYCLRYRDENLYINTKLYYIKTGFIMATARPVVIESISYTK